VPQPADLLLRHGHVITMDAERRILADGAIAVHDGRIAAIGPDRDVAGRVEAGQVRDLAGALVHPGLVDAHAHPGSLELIRGFGPKGSADWNAVEDVMWEMTNPETEYLGTMQACMEAVANGVTTYGDTGGSFHLADTARAIETVGMRGFPGHLLIDGALPAVSHQHGASMSEAEVERLSTPTAECLARLEEQLARYPFDGDGLVRCAVTLYGAGRNSDELLQRASELAARHGAPMAIHQSWGAEEVEASLVARGRRPVEHLADLGVLGPRTTLVHMIHLDRREVEIVAETGCAVVHCPSASMRRGVGAIRGGSFPELRRLGVAVGLGSDGFSGKRDVLRQAFLAALGYREMRGEVPIFTGEDVLEMATLDGARALGVQGEIGSLEPGKRADLVVHAVDRPESHPRYADAVDRLVYYAQAATVRQVFVGGELVFDAGTFTRFDAHAVYDQIDEVARHVEERLGADTFAVWPLVR
jgi:5-methylthioadenosine/S-adenosylhomocysteine deaminase